MSKSLLAGLAFPSQKRAGRGGISCWQACSDRTVFLRDLAGFTQLTGAASGYLLCQHIVPNLPCTLAVAWSVLPG